MFDVCICLGHCLGDGIHDAAGPSVTALHVLDLAHKVGNAETGNDRGFRVAHAGCEVTVGAGTDVLAAATSHYTEIQPK